MTGMKVSREKLEKMSLQELNRLLRKEARKANRTIKFADKKEKGIYEETLLYNSDYNALGEIFSSRKSKDKKQAVDRLIKISNWKQSSYSSLGKFRNLQGERFERFKQNFGVSDDKEAKSLIEFVKYLKSKDREKNMLQSDQVIDFYNEFKRTPEEIRMYIQDVKDAYIRMEKENKSLLRLSYEMNRLNKQGNYSYDMAKISEMRKMFGLD